MARSASNLGSMSVDALLKLRDDIGVVLSQKSKELQRQLVRLGLSTPGVGRGGNSRKGLKVAPKYRGPDGETWAGRGATPRWLTALMKEGHKRDEFLISSPIKPERPRKRADGKKTSLNKRK